MVEKKLVNCAYEILAAKARKHASSELNYTAGDVFDIAMDLLALVSEGADDCLREILAANLTEDK